MAKIIPFPKYKKWGDWMFNPRNLTLQLKPTRNIVYEIDLEDINSCGEMLDVIFQINGKNKNLYGEYVVQDLVNALDDIYSPQANVCSWGASRNFNGSLLAKKYMLELSQ